MEKNAEACPLTNCFKSIIVGDQAFTECAPVELVGVFTLPKERERVFALAKILKAKGAEAIYIVTCAFAHKSKEGWKLGQGFEEGRDELYAELATGVGLPVIKGSAHLPAGYTPQRFEP